MNKWYVRYDADGQTRICEEDFTHDVELIVTGDFEDQEQRSAFATALAKTLSDYVQREGWRLVPEHPTEDMLIAMAVQSHCIAMGPIHPDARVELEKRYAKLLAASPSCEGGHSA
jgi:hypothetical protein